MAEQPDSQRRKRAVMSRKQFLAGGAGLALGVSVATSSLERARPARAAANVAWAPTSRFFATAFVEYSDRLDTESDGDLWPSCWADDGQLYAANGDGRGFSDDDKADIVMNRIAGTPETKLSGARLADSDAIANVWGDPSMYNRKPTGMVAVDGDGDGKDELYVAVQDLRFGDNAFDDAPHASISRSTDYGTTWLKTDKPMFTDHRFTTIFFLDFGQSQKNARILGADGAGYVYAYGMDNNWRDSFTDTVPDPTSLYLARVPKAHIQDRAAWEFFAGASGTGEATWSTELARRVPVLRDERRVYPSLQGDGVSDMTVISQGSVVYNAPLDRYLYTSWTEYTFEFYEAPKPWGPWSLFLQKDFGAYPWFGRPAPSDCPGPKNGGYATTIPSKFISADGKTMWVQANWFVGVGCGEPNYNFSLRKLTVEPFAPSTPANAPDPAHNLARVEGTTPIEKSARFGHGSYYNDGITKDQSEDSLDRENKEWDFWGYTWPREYNLNRVVYTTGNMSPPDGGWFTDKGGGLSVQVRQNFVWVDVTGLAISPAYPYDKTAGPNKTYTLTFDATHGDGVRIIGHPGGDAAYTSIAELAVYFDR